MEMELQLTVRLSDKLYLRDPEQSELGKKILKEGARLLDELGLEDFTFRKLAKELQTNESSIYRYFENKHRLLIYMVSWYWRWLEYQVLFQTNNLSNPDHKLQVVLDILLLEESVSYIGTPLIDTKLLHRIVIKEGSKAYLTNHVTEDNKDQLFKPYKDLCGRIAVIIQEKNPDYKYARSLTSTLIEMAHYQHFFMNHLPSLTDFGQSKDPNELKGFLKSLLAISM